MVSASAYAEILFFFVFLKAMQNKSKLFQPCDDHFCSVYQSRLLVQNDLHTAVQLAPQFNHCNEES